MKDAIVSLLKVKSLITLALSGVFAYLAINGIIEAKDVMTVYLMIISFYFGTQAEKNADKQETTGVITQGPNDYNI